MGASFFFFLQQMKIDVGALDMVGDIVGGGGDLEKKRMRRNASARRVKFDTRKPRQAVAFKQTSRF